MSIVIDTPDGIAFARAASRNAALQLELKGMKRRGQTAYSIVKEVYGFVGNRKAVSTMLDEYVEGVLAIRAMKPEYITRLDAILSGIVDALEVQGITVTKDLIDREVQGGFSRGFITEQEGNDACLRLFVAVVQQYAGAR